MDTIDLSTIAEIAGSVTTSVILLYLLVREQKEHEITRTEARIDREKIRTEQREDQARHTREIAEILKSIAGLTAMYAPSQWRPAHNPEDDTPLLK